MKLFARFFLAVLSMAALSCSEVDKEENPYADPDIKNKLGKVVGKTYYLSEYRPANGPKRLPNRSFFTLTLVDDSTITGRLDCYEYTAKVIWNDSGVLDVENQNFKGQGCGTPFVQLERKMFFILPSNGLQLELINSSEEWSGLFLAN